MKSGVMAVLATAFLVMTRTLPAAELRVQVYDKAANSPLADASVCLGTRARLDQFGAKKTDAKGFVEFSDVPSAPLLVTASRTGYLYEQQALVTTNTSRMLVLSLPPGGGGLVCSTPGKSTSGSSSLSVASFRINAGTRTADGSRVVLDYRVSGQANEYRASERSDFSDAGWQALTHAPAFMLSGGSGKKQVYFQVRRASTINGGILETVSPVVSATITVN